MDKSYNAAVQSEVTKNLALKYDNNIENWPLLRKTGHMVLTARKNMERDIVYIQKKISAMQLDHKKNGLSKSARKRLRKKRQTDLKLAFHLDTMLTVPENIVHLEAVKKASKTTESVVSINTKDDQQLSEKVCNLPGLNTQKQQTLLKHPNPKQGTNAKKISSVAESSRRKTCKKSKPEKTKKLSAQNLLQSCSPNVRKEHFQKIQHCTCATKSCNKTVDGQKLPLYSFVLRDKLKALPTEDIIWLLEMQNYFVTNEWIILQRRETSDDDVTITVGIDPKTESLLRNKKFQASLLRTTVKFKAEKNDFINKMADSTMRATDSRSTSCKQGYSAKVDSSVQAEDKPFSWLGKWQTFTTVLNNVN